MKKTLIIMTVLAGFAASSFGQGTVLFSTSASASTKVSTNAVVGGAATGLTAANDGTVANTYYFALFYSTSGSTTVGSSSSSVVGTNGTYAFNSTGQGWTFVVNATNNTSAGKFNPYTSLENSDGSITIPTVSAASTAELVAIGWSASIGSSWQSLQTYLANPTFNAWVGQSAVASIPLGNAPGTGSLNPESLFGSTTGQVGGILLGQVAPAIVPTPEPATLALAGLSGASLLLFRRRK